MFRVLEGKLREAQITREISEIAWGFYLNRIL